MFSPLSTSPVINSDLVLFHVKKNASIMFVICKITQLLFAGTFLQAPVLHIGIFSCWLPEFMRKGKLGFCVGQESKDLEMEPATVE